jgi:SAM-dependent methyltransferase
MDIVEQVRDGLPEIAVVALTGLFYLPLMLYIAAAHVADYKVLKRYHMNGRRYGLNISCGRTDGGGVNADVVQRDVPNFVRVGDVYNLPFHDGEFGTALCSHTLEHVEDPDRFYGELRRVSDEVVVFVPPVWDIMGLLAFREHKWQFLTLRTKHVNSLPRKVKLPYWGLQKRFGQKLRC